MTQHCLLQSIAVDYADGAAGQCLHFAGLGELRENQPVEAEEIARIVEGMDLPASILMPGGGARDAFKKDREMLRHVRSGGRFTSAYSTPHLRQIPECLEVGPFRDA
jgi:hypothetical protein